MGTVASLDSLSGNMPAATMSIPDQQEPVFGKRNLIIVASLFVAAFLSIIASEIAFHIPILGDSNAPHYVYQAESFLHGR